MNRMDSALLSFMKFIALSAFAVSPIIFLPVLSNYYDTAKLLSLGFFSLVLVFLWSIRTAVTRTVMFSLYPRVLVIFGLFLAAAISTLLSSANKVEALVSPSGLATYLFLFILMFIAGMLSDRSFIRSLTWTLIGAGTALSLVAVYMFFGIGPLMFPDALYLKDPLWTPVGSALTLITVLLIILPLAVTETVRGFAERKDVAIAIGLVSSALTASAIITTAIRLFPGLTNSLLPLSTSWSILMEMFKSPKFALFGVGPENFLSAFTIARPAGFNSGPFWNTRFTLSGSAVLHLATVMGSLGLIAALTTLRAMASGVRSTDNPGLKISLGIAILSLFFTPYHLSVMIIAAALLLLIPAPDSATTRSFRIPDHIGWVAYAAAVVGLVFAGAGGYFGIRYLLSETIFMQSLKAAEANNGGLTYNKQIEAIQLNPYNTSFRIAYAQTNLALANSLSENIQATASGETVNLSETDRQTISQLIQQAIRESKIATQLAPDYIYSWETLARTYASIINIVNESDQWAIASYQRAIQLDPTNPSQRLNLAGIYIARQDYDNAVTQLQAAMALKPDAAITYYNLAYVFGARKEYLKQASALKQTLTLLPADSEDAKRVAEELDKIKSQLSPDELSLLEGNAPQGTQNQSPLPIANPTPEPEITPKLELPEEASPAVSPATQPARL